MNFLAHALLAGPSAADRVGGIAGDFVKGRLDPPPPDYAADLIAGVVLHRRIDSYADTHPAFSRSRARVGPVRRRVAGIMVDVFYDHFLACHWQRFSTVPLEVFAAETYRLIAARADPLPPVFGTMFERMRAEDWLTGYREVETIARVLDRMAIHRLRRPNPLAGAGEELVAGYAGFEADFLEFFPAAQNFAAEVRAARESGPRG